MQFVWRNCLWFKIALLLNFVISGGNFLLAQRNTSQVGYIDYFILGHSSITPTQPYVVLNVPCYLEGSMSSGQFENIYFETCDGTKLVNLKSGKRTSISSILNSSYGNFEYSSSSTTTVKGKIAADKGTLNIDSYKFYPTAAGLSLGCLRMEAVWKTDDDDNNFVIGRENHAFKSVNFSVNFNMPSGIAFSRTAPNTITLLTNTNKDNFGGSFCDAEHPATFYMKGTASSIMEFSISSESYYSKSVVVNNLDKQGDSYSYYWVNGIFQTPKETITFNALPSNANLNAEYSEVTDELKVPMNLRWKSFSSYVYETAGRWYLFRECGTKIELLATLPFATTSYIDETADVDKEYTYYLIFALDSWLNPPTAKTITDATFSDLRESKSVSTMRSCTKAEKAKMSVVVESTVSPRCGESDGSIRLKANGEYTYLWSNGSSTKDLENVAIGEYMVTVTNPLNSCEIKLTAEIENAIKQPEISLVTVSQQTGKNLIVWLRQKTDLIKEYVIYRESEIENKYEAIGRVKYNELSVYEDKSADPMTQAWSYKISAIDNCGNETPLSSAHTTLYLAKNIGMNGAINLDWTAYEGLDYSTFYVLRETKVNNYTYVDTLKTLSKSIMKYTDLVPAVGVSNYYVGIKMDEIVNPKGYAKIETGPFSMALSNIAEAKMVNNNNNPNANPNSIESASSVAVSSSDGVIKIENANGEFVKIYDVLGRMIYSGTQTEIEVAQGVYEVFVGDQIITISVK